MGDSKDTRSVTQDKETDAEKIREETEDADKGDLSEADKVGKKEETVEDKDGVEESKTETILSSQSLKSSNPSISMPTDHTTTPSPKDKHLNRNQSDILPSLREIPPDEDPSLMIFSSKGLPTKKYFRRREVNSTILPFGFNEPETPRTSTRVKAEAQLTPKISQTVPRNVKLEEQEAKKVPFGDKNPNVPNPSVSRNVLTGDGVGSKNEFKSKSARRKDGNPVLGLGYEEPVVASNVGRVPPGGFSSGLW